jgi:prepilin-type N-terminal cleavage/methylation domain-containing protein
MRKAERSRQVRRRGFTLVELLVVIAIIATLVALTASAVIRYIDVQAEKNTERTLYTVDTELDKQWRKVVEDANKEPIPDVILVPWANGDTERARVIYIKARLKQEFPMSFAEAMNPVPLPPLQDYVTKLTKAFPPSGPPQTNTPSAQERSVCLLMALERGRGGAGTIASKLGTDTIKPAGNGLNMIVDAWGTPIIFYRWPTLNPEVDASNAGQGRELTLRDAQDESGRLVDSGWWSSPGLDQPILRFQFEANLHLVSKVAPGKVQTPYVYDQSQSIQANPYEYYMVPTLVSAGPNKKFGILPPQQPYINPNPMGSPVVQPAPGPWPDPMQIDGTSDSNDNIYSFRLRMNGKGN